MGKRCIIMSITVDGNAIGRLRYLLFMNLQSSNAICFPLVNRYREGRQSAQWDFPIWYVTASVADTCGKYDSWGNTYVSLGNVARLKANRESM